MARSIFTRVVSQRSDQDRDSAWREVGWIFRDGQTLSIERCGERSRMREVQF